MGCRSLSCTPPAFSTSGCPPRTPRTKAQLEHVGLFGSVSAASYSAGCVRAPDPPCSVAMKTPSQTATQRGLSRSGPEAHPRIRKANRIADGCLVMMPPVALTRPASARLPAGLKGVVSESPSLPVPNPHVGPGGQAKTQDQNQRLIRPAVEGFWYPPIQRISLGVTDARPRQDGSR